MENQVKQEQLALLFQALPVAALATLLITGVIVSVFRNVVPAANLLWWSSGVVVVSLSRLGMLVVYRKNEGEKNTEVWLKWFVCTLVLLALILSSASWVIYPSNDLNHQLMMILVFIGIAPGGAVTLAPHFFSTAIFVTILLTPLVFRFAIDDQLPFLFAPMIVVYIGVLISTSSGLTKFIKQSIRFQQESVVARKEAEAANRAKSEFLANMSHEFRTALNSVLGFSSMIENQMFGPTGSEKFREYAADIHSSSEHLLALINDILDLATVEAGKHTLAKEVLNFREVVDDCTPIIAGAASQKSIKFTNKVPEELPRLYADRRAIKQILLNLLSNAIKYIPEEGTIDLDATASNGSLTVEIHDSEIGIPAEKLPVIVDPFVRSESDPEVFQERFGLGLAVVKSLLDLHGGDLDIKSEVGVGTTVKVTLPF